MTITDNTNTPGEGEVAPAKESRRFDVEYTLDILDGDLPPAGHGGGGGGNRTSPLELKLEELKGREDAHGKWVLIGKYGKATAAGAAANVLRQRHGRNANAEGFEFAYRKIDDGNGSHINGLFVRFDPTKVVPGAMEQHKQDEAERLAKLAAARKEREAAEAGTVNGGVPSGTETAAGDTPAKTTPVAEKVAAAQKAAAKK